MPEKGKKGKKSKDVTASASDVFSDNIVKQQTITGINDWRAEMESIPYRIFNYQRYIPPEVAKIPDILKSRELPQSSVFDEPPELSLDQEKLSEEQQRQMEEDMISSMNLNTVYDIGALDWGRPPINDIYDRHLFETYASGYKYDQFGNPIAYMKKPTQPSGKKYSNMKKNYIPTSQLIQTAKVQSDLHKKLTKSTKITKKK
ncbi:MAG: hypothetical protein EZS28_008662 [Streblomastix strix]|uniref:Uncharacterized protein n=1 Tax=Streblomastix strix TaxID=222440 RepID=A0A5J4WLI1_9EUKA|nr:MAG: hypothetical protein EZS28_008662 [Streblomastix strix]